MANSFNKEELVAFEDILETFSDMLVLSRHVSVYKTSQQEMQRSSDTIWRPMPYVSNSFTSTPGVSISGDYKNMTQLAVPSTIGFSKTVAFKMNTLELRDALQEGRLADAGKRKLASDVNIAIMNTASAQGTLVVPIATAAGDYDDIALCDSIMNEQGVPEHDRFLGLSSRDYNGIAGNLSAASRSFGNPKSDKAYERSYVGDVAGFSTYKFDYANRIAAAAGGVTTIDTQNAALNYLVPKATSVSVGGQINVDNRYQTVTVSNTAGVVAGDAFTIDGVVAVHQLTKVSTGQLKTFRVISVTNGTQMVISPGIISNQVGDSASEQYKNVTVTVAAAANINWLNVDAANINVFWQKDALEILPGRYAIEGDSGTAVIRGTTDQGIELVMQKFYDIDSMVYKYRLDTLFGVVNKQPEMSGILLFNQ